VGEGGRAALTLKEHLQPTEVLWLPWFVGDGRARPAYAVRREPLAAKSAGGQPFATLRPRWARWPDAAQVCLAVGEGEGPDRTAVGAVMVRPAEWTRPYEQFPAVRAIGDGSGMTVEFPLETGGRAWALLAGPLDLSQRDPKGADPFTWPEVRSGLEWVRHLHTPPDPRLGRRLLVPAGEGGWGDAVGRLFGVAAAGVRPSDPDLARVWMGMYRNYYGEAGSGDLATDVLLADPSLEGRPLEDADWPSRACEGFGAVLRSRVGSPREAFVAFRCGGAAEGGRGDALSFHFTGAGVPIAPAWHTPADLVPIQEHMHNRVSLGENENMDAAGRLLVMRRTAAADVVAGQVQATHLRRMPARPDEIEPGTALARRRLEHPARYRRWLMLVKHPDGSALEDYLVVRDELATAEAATFNLFVLARQVRQEGRLFRFEGQLSADAVLYLATPEPETATLADWGWPAGGGKAVVPPDFEPGEGPWRRGELQQWVRVRARPGQAFLAVLYPYHKGREPPTFEPLADGRGVRVRLAGEREAVYLASEPPKEAGGQAVVRRGKERTVVLQPTVNPM